LENKAEIRNQKIKTQDQVHTSEKECLILLGVYQNSKKEVIGKEVMFFDSI